MVLFHCAIGVPLLCVAALVEHQPKRIWMMLLGAALSFFVLPHTSALILVLFAFTVSAFLVSPTVFIAKVVLWGFATIIAVDHIHSLWQGTAPTIQNGTQTLVDLTGFGEGGCKGGPAA